MDTALYQDESKSALAQRPSVRFVERPTLTLQGSLHAVPANDLTLNEDEGESEPDSEPIILGLAIRRSRLVVFTVTMLAMTVGVTVWFHAGMALTHFETRDKNTTEQIQILDDYNAYAGHIATLFGKPVELFVTVAVQVIALRFMADTFTRPEMGWKISALTLMMGAGVGYMISNGFNALNVQLRPQKITAVVAQADLGIETIYNKSYFESQSSIVEYARVDDETAAGNPITNTILRTLILPTEPRRETGCVHLDDTAASVEAVQESFLHRAFPQRDWQGRILQEALPSELFRLVVDPTDPTENDRLNSSALPMNASLAADLFYYAMLIGPTNFPWGDPHAFVNQSDLIARYPVAENQTRTVSDAATRLYGLLPPAAADEATEKAWFVQASVAAATRQFAASSRTKTSDIAMEFFHTQITSAIVFNAITFDVEVDPMLLATSATADNQTRYTTLDQIDNCTWPEHCMIRKPDYKVVEPMYDPPAQVFAYRLCTDANGVETLLGNVTILGNGSMTFVDADCGATDTTAMLVVSIGKRLEADALEQNVSRSANGTVVNDDTLATVTNLRKIYSFTVGRLAWQFTDLATAFNADCGVASGCLGLHMPLDDHVSSSSTPSNKTTEHLLVGRDQLPLYTVDTLSQELSLGRSDLLVLNEPPDSPKPSQLYHILTGDVLLPHNVRNMTWDPQLVKGKDCSARVASRVVHLVDNHFYMEHTLQTTYTTGVFFLFQNAVVRSSLALSHNEQSLAFSANSQHVAVWASTPAQNMWLTLAGCCVLSAGLLVVLLKALCFAPTDHGAFASISDPHAIARVLLDERQYPPLFVRRRVVEGRGLGNADNLAIAALELHHHQQDARGGNTRKQTGQEIV